jgi:hypothetical protein
MARPDRVPSGFVTDAIDGAAVMAIVGIVGIVEIAAGIGV